MIDIISNRVVSGSILLAITMLGSAASYAVVPEKSAPDIFDTAYLIQVFGSLLLVFACLFGLAFVLRRVNGIPETDRKIIQILGSAKVGSREKVLLLKAGEQELLVGVSAGSVRTLHVFGDASADAGANAANKKSEFASVLEANSNAVSGS